MDNKFDQLNIKYNENIKFKFLDSFNDCIFIF